MAPRKTAQNNFIEPRKAAAASGNMVSLITMFVCPKILDSKTGQRCGLKRVCRQDADAYFAQVKAGNRENPRYIEQNRLCPACARTSRIQLDKEQTDSLVNDVAQLVAGAEEQHALLPGA